MKKCLSVLLSVIMLISSSYLYLTVHATNNMTENDASISLFAKDEYSVGDVITFGKYPQSAVTNSNTVAHLEKINLNDDNVVYYDNNKYLKYNSTWYIFEDISWNILSVDNGKYFVQSSKVLDWQAYNISGTASNWYYSSINTWLNSIFINRAFTATEKNNINDYEIENNYCKVFVISYSDAINTKYGFNSSYSYDDQRRVAYSTSFAQGQGASRGACDWMLRESGTVNSIRYSLSGDGCVGTCHGTVNVSYKLGVRPAMIINYGKQVHTVANYQAMNTEYADTYFNGCAKAMDGYSDSVDLCIPELSESYNMIPQGIAYYEAKKWVLISSYHNSKVMQTSIASKIFALDAETGNLVAEFDLKNSKGEKYTGHAGGIAVTNNNLYITDSDGNNNCLISYIPLSELTEGTKTIQFAASYDASGSLNSTNTSYLSFTDGILWTGNCYGPKTGKKFSSSSPSVMVGYRISGANSEEEWNSLICHSSSDYTVHVPVSVQYIQSATVSDGRLIMVSSYQRKNDSTIYYASIDDSCSISNLKSCAGIPMMEGFFLYDDKMFFITESAAYYYYGYDKSKLAKNPTDVVWSLDYKSLLGESKYPPTENDVKPITTSFTIDKKTGSTSIEFKQNWFKQNSSVYNHELGQFCSQFSMIGYGTENEVRSALAKMNFICDDFSVDGKTFSCVNKSSSKEQVNYFLSNKSIYVNGENYTLIFAGFIGSHLEQWYSNFDPGTGDTHKGFNNAKTYVYDIINNYLSYLNVDMSKTKILITGHSRGAATANLVSAQFIKDNEIADENIYTYAFATPNSTKLSERNNTEFKRIFNIVNPEDFVTKCMPTAWGYGRYGTTFVLPSKNNSYNYKKYYLANMETYFSDFTSGDTYYPFKDSEAATYNVVSALTSTVRDIDQFYKMKFKWLNDRKSIFDFFNTTLCPFVGEHKGSEKKSQAKETFLKTFAYRWQSDKTILNITDYFILNEGISNISDGSISEEYFTYSHCVQTYCAYMMSLSESQIQIYRSGLHNSVNCPVDVEIIDKSTGEVVGRIVNNVIDEEIAAKDNAVTITVDGDSKQFWLPSDGYYDVILTGNDDGKMDYTVSEIDSDGGEIKRSNFFDVDVADGESMTGIPEIEESSLNDYNLDSGDENTIDSTVILETEDLNDINIETASFGKGCVTESQNATLGDYITLTAENEGFEDSSFIGWFINDELVSTDETYSFVAKENVSIEAEFTRYLGDVSGDNVINSLDALYVLEFATDSVNFNQFEFSGSDVNKDGDVDSLDALMILQYTVGIIPEFEADKE